MKNCNQCGKCCIKYGAVDISASAEDIAWWDEHKPHIFKYVRNNSIWFNPSTGSAVKKCPWLQISRDQKYICEIYHDRPEDCRLYPSSILEMIADQCEMLEPSDLSNTKHAQRHLDFLMAGRHHHY